jgi:hypothetical protein
MLSHQPNMIKRSYRPTQCGEWFMVQEGNM